MSPDIPAPPEAEVIRLARKAMDMTAQSAAEASRADDGKGISAAYWRDVERGHGGRRGQRVPVRASDRALAAMARVVGVTPAQLTAAGRDDAARVLEEARRRDSPGPAAAPPPVISRGDSGPYAAIDELAAMTWQPLIWLRLAELAEHGDPRPTGEALFLEGGDPLGAGENIAAGLADAWDKGMARGLDLDTAVKFAARAWALMDAYRARTHNRASGRSGALTPT